MFTKRVGILSLAVTLLGGCGDGGLAEPEAILAPVVTADPTAGITFPVVLLSENGPEGGVPAGPVVRALSDALVRVAEGGTIRVFPGTYVTERLEVTKGVTIEAAGGERPTITGIPGSWWLFNLGVQTWDEATPTPGPVVLRGLRLEHPDQTALVVMMGTRYSTVTIEDVEFVVPAPIGVGFAASASTGDGITIRNSVFRNGGLGIGVDHTAGVQIVGNRFWDLGDGAIEGGPRVIRGNTFDGCSRERCIQVFSYSGTPYGDLDVEDNLVIGGIPTNMLISTDGGGGGAVTIARNTVVGAEGAINPIDRNGLGIETNNWASATIAGNVVTSVRYGIIAVNAGSLVSLSATDNRIDDVLAGFAAGEMLPESSPVVFTRNDVTNYGVGADLFVAQTNFDLRCVWWGPGTEASGPTAMNVPAPGVFTPWATEPIAGRPDVRCP